MNRVLRAAVTAAFFLSIGVLVDLRMAKAAQQCAPLAVWEKALSDQYREKPAAVAAADGKDGQAYAMIWYESDSGTWTQLVVDGRGRACLMASGEGGINRVSGGQAPSDQAPHARSPGRPNTPPAPDARHLTPEQRRLIKRVIESRDA